MSHDSCKIFFLDSITELIWRNFLNCEKKKGERLGRRPIFEYSEIYLRMKEEVFPYTPTAKMFMIIVLMHGLNIKHFKYIGILIWIKS